MRPMVLPGGQGVAGSNPVSPTTKNPRQFKELPFWLAGILWLLGESKTLSSRKLIGTWGLQFSLSFLFWLSRTASLCRPDGKDAIHF